MKKIFFLLALIFTGSVIHAQDKQTAPYQNDSTLPMFSLLETDSTTWFNNMDLPKDKPVIFIYFNPDCGHCQLTAHEFQEKMDKFKDAFFVWVSYLSVSEIKHFAEEYKMLAADNIVIGRDTKYAIPGFFKVKYTPYIAVYNDQGKLLQTYDGGTDPDTIDRLLHPAKE